LAPRQATFSEYHAQNPQFLLALGLLNTFGVSTQGNRLERACQLLVLLHVATLLIALAVGLAISRGAEANDRDDRSTFERETPHIANWPRHARPFPRG
jgi:hypothetical protein